MRPGGLPRRRSRRCHDLTSSLRDTHRWWRPTTRATGLSRRHPASRCRAARGRDSGAPAKRGLVPRWRQHPPRNPPRRVSPSRVRGCPPRRRPPECEDRSCSLPPQILSAFARAPRGGPCTVLHRSTTRTRAPPSGRLSASIRPPCSSTIFFTIASPRPVPLGLLVT